MGFYRDLAEPLSQRGIPTVPLRPKTKIAFIDDWPTSATTNLGQIVLWDAQFPDANCASVAKAEMGGVWFFEFDKPEVPGRIESETGQSLVSISTFKVRSSPGKGHIYFKQSEASLAMGNIAQAFVKNGDWSARVGNQYVVSPGSLHPTTGLPYEIRVDAPIIEAPQWLINWCISQKLDKKKLVNADGDDPIPQHARNDTLTSIAGSFRHNGINYPELLPIIVRINNLRCQPPLPESEVLTIVGSICNYKPGVVKPVIVGGHVAGAPPVVPQPIPPEEAEESVQIATIPYPKFPLWVMNGTSIYEGLVKPFCDVNSRYPEFMFMPAVTLLLNYVAAKSVYVKDKNLIPSIFMVSIGRAGRVIKSSCVQDAISYFKFMGCLEYGKQSASNANGKALVFTPASPEGLGKEMNRLNCNNGILFYDELSTLTNKASIENSSLSSNLLTLYESGQFQNMVKNPKDSYCLEPGTYCVSLIACSTDKNFALNWSKLAGKSTGLNDRFFFLYQPEVLKDLTSYQSVSTQDGAVRTHQLIQKALDQKVYAIQDNVQFNDFLKQNENSNRAAIRAEKFALYFAIDLGRDEIDDECVERALALVDYEMKVKKYLHVYEAATRQAAVQLEVIYQLRKAGGVILRRELDRIIHPERLGTSLWNDVYIGLIKAGWCKEEGLGTKGDPQRLVLLRMPEDDD